MIMPNNNSAEYSGYNTAVATHIVTNNATPKAYDTNIAPK